MFKYHNQFALGFSFLFSYLLFKFTGQLPVFRFLAAYLFILLTLLGLYNYYFLQFLSKYNFWIWIRPILLSFSILGVFFCSPNDFLKYCVALLGFVFILVFELMLKVFSDNININEILIIIFGNSIAFCGASYFYFPNFSYYFPGLFFVLILLATRSFLEFIPQDPKTKIVTALSLSLFSVEFFWVLGFLPFHYSVLAVILFDLYYFLLVMIYYFLFNNLNAKKIQFHLWLITISILATVCVTPWAIIR